MHFTGTTMITANSHGHNAELIVKRQLGVDDEQT